MRWLVAVLIAAAIPSGCTLVNRLDPDLVVEICDNRDDDDDDGDTDCVDTDCADDPSCAESSLATCIDGVDNDLDARVDCADGGCGFTERCLPGAAFVRDPGCPRRPVAGVQRLFDGFLGAGIGPDWTLNADDASGPRKVESGVELSPDPGKVSWLQTARQFEIGTRNGVSLTFFLRTDGTFQSAGAGPNVTFGFVSGSRPTR